jgi:hypothetical protein
MGNPVKVRVDPNTDVVLGFQEMSTADMKGAVAGRITEAFVYNIDNDTQTMLDGKGQPAQVILHEGTAQYPYTLGVDSQIGTFVDKKRNDTIGTHPTSGAQTTVKTYTFLQNNNVNVVNMGDDPFPVILDDNNRLKDSTETERKDFLDIVIDAYCEQSASTAGQYYLSANAPNTGGTWVNRGNIEDTQVDNTSFTKTLWQKSTANSTVPTGVGNNIVIREQSGNTDDESLQEADVVRYRQMAVYLGNRILERDGPGIYALSENAPSTGTWQQMGETLTDQVKNIATYAYAGTYTGTYTGNYAGYYSGTYSGTYSGSYSPRFAGYTRTWVTYTGYYTGYYTGNYTGNYSGSYSGDYAGYYDGATIISTSSSQSNKKLWLRTA